MQHHKSYHSSAKKFLQHHKHCQGKRKIFTAKKNSDSTRKTIIGKEKFSQRHKNSDCKEKLSQQKKNSHNAKSILTAKEKLSQQKTNSLCKNILKMIKNSHSKTRKNPAWQKKSRTIVIYEIIYTVHLVHENSCMLFLQTVFITLKLFLK